MDAFFNWDDYVEIDGLDDLLQYSPQELTNTSAENQSGLFTPQTLPSNSEAIEGILRSPNDSNAISCGDLIELEGPALDEILGLNKSPVGDFKEVRSQSPMTTQRATSVTDRKERPLVYTSFSQPDTLLLPVGQTPTDVSFPYQPEPQPAPQVWDANFIGAGFQASTTAVRGRRGLDGDSGMGHVHKHRALQPVEGTIRNRYQPQLAAPRVYQNPLLNDFNNAELALQIIDRYWYPLPDTVQAALAHSLKRPQVPINLGGVHPAVSQQGSGHMSDVYHDLNPIRSGVKRKRGIDETLSQWHPTEYGGPPRVQLSQRPPQYTTPPSLSQTRLDPISRTPTPNGKPYKNGRTQNIATTNSQKEYNRLAKRPKTWGIENHKFEYSSHGELEPGRKYTAQELRTYFENHPLHSIRNGLPDPKKSKLRLWIEGVPADSKSRYPTKESSKCRFEDCPVGNTIRIGQYRVAFDEQSWKDDNTDPYIHAGYVHLHCLEKHFNFPQFCREFNVRPDTRVFKAEPNRMAINRDHKTMERICVNYKNHARARGGPFVHEDSLTCLLTLEHIKKGPVHTKVVRQERGGMNIERHLGNLDVIAAWNATRAEDRASKVTSGVNSTSASRSTSRKREIDERILEQERESQLQKDLEEALQSAERGGSDGIDHTKHLNNLDIIAAWNLTHPESGTSAVVSGTNTASASRSTSRKRGSDEWDLEDALSSDSGGNKRQRQS